MSDCRCGCCEGVEILTPLPTANRPGLPTLSYRVGTHATFLETMLARLSGHRLEDGRRPLQRLRTRDADDPAIALLDAWATVADVLTFYQERIANEGYLTTATERRSILELSRLVGYRLRPGVAASVYLAFTLQDDYDVEVPVGTRAQSIPGPGELPQPFETEEALEARARWNAIPARLTHPPFLRAETGFSGTRTFHVRGVQADVGAGDTVLFICGAVDGVREPYTVQEVDEDAAAERTLVRYTPYGAPFEPDEGESEEPDEEPDGRDGDGQRPASALTRLGAAVEALRKQPSLPPASRFALARSPERTYSAASDLGPRLLARFTPRLADSLFTAYANAPVAGGRVRSCRVHAMRVRAAPFGHNAPRPFERVVLEALPTPRGDWRLVAEDREPRSLHLDAVYDGITAGSWVVIDRADTDVGPLVARVERVRTISRADYGISATVTQLRLDRAWLGVEEGFGVLRATTVHVRSESLELAETPIEEDVAGAEIELNGLYEGLGAGRWLVVGGERTDVPGADGEPVEGVEARELVMLAGVEHDVRRIVDADGNERELPGDTLHTRLLLSEPLAYTYRRDTVAVNANVARASHGETKEEVLGGGDGTVAFQAFELKQPPLTWVAAPTPEGVESTLEVRIDGVRWPAVETLLELDGDERGYVTRTDDDGVTAVVFGDGRRGARLPTGVENVAAVYRSGIGRAGNVAAEQISLLATRPLGVREVINPERSSGGADPEDRDQARRNVPLAVQALDRLVSVTDYASFARRFAGIGKAAAVQLADGRREIVHLTIAGADDIPIDPSSDLQRNLLAALARFGDPNVPLRVEPREAVFVVLGARVAVHEDHLWENVEPEVRAALLDAFGFDRRDFGEDVLLSRVISTIHGVAGVEWVDVDLLDGISETDAADPEALAARLEGLAAAAEAGGSGGSACDGGGQPRRRVPVEPARVDPAASDPRRRILPAQLAWLSPELPDTLILTEVVP